MAEGGEPDDGDVLRRELEALRLRVAELQRAAGRHEHGDGATLTQREELLREAERVAHLGTWTWDVASDRATWSDEMYRILGLRPGSIQPSVAAFYAAVHPDDLARVHAHKDQSVRDGMLPLVDCRMVRPDGSVRYTTVSSSILFDGSGAVRGVVGGVQDRTESLEAEARLRRTLSLLEEAQACAQLGSWRYVPATGEIEWSAELYRILGLPPDVRPTPERFFECVLPEDRERFRINHGAPVSNEHGGEIDGRVQRPDGQVRHVRVRAFPASGPGGVHELRGTVLDVTDQVRMREELAHAQKMEAVGRLAGGIAHDFNNLLTVITGNLELLAARIGRSAELEHSFQALNSAASLTRRLLAFGRKAQLSLKQVGPNELVRSTTALMHRLVGDEVRLEITLGDGLPMILVDPLEIERALVNLVANARDAMPGGGVVRIGTEARRVAGKLQVELSVADRGRGIDEADRPHLFEPFFTTRSDAGGTGLGLATVLGTAEQHGGTVRVEAREGGGSVFTIVLPGAEQEARGQALQADSVRPHVRSRPLNILVLDDEQAVANVTQLILEAHGHTVQGVSHPVEALRIWAEQHTRIDLVICDVVMSHMRGPELVARLSQAGATPRVLFITGYSEEAVRAGLGHPVLAKPFTAAALLRAIDDVVAAR
jgi:two-component system cell cycle sensor histidine kinase/response regulator CckA